MSNMFYPPVLLNPLSNPYEVKIAYLRKIHYNEPKLKKYNFDGKGIQAESEGERETIRKYNSLWE